jgi:hypothetical protein
MRSSAASSLAIIALGAVGAPARAEERVELPLQPRVAATFSNGQQDLEAGVEYTIGGLSVDDATTEGTAATDLNRGRMFASVSLPFGTGKVVRIDKDTSSWRINLGGDLLHAIRRKATTPAEVDHSRSHYGFTLSFGHADFEYHPGGGEEAMTQGHWSVSATARAVWIHVRQSEQWAPQIAITYDRAYAASPQTSIVDPATMELPARVVRTVSLAPPGASPALAARISCPYAIWPSSQLLIGPSISHAFAGTDRAYSPFDGASGRLEGEMWLYYFPRLAPEVGKTNVRIGVAPFATVRTYGDDGHDRFSYGALAELRINSEIFDY